MVLLIVLMSHKLCAPKHCFTQNIMFVPKLYFGVIEYCIPITFCPYVNHIVLILIYIITCKVYYFQRGARFEVSFLAQSRFIKVSLLY